MSYRFSYRIIPFYPLLRVVHEIISNKGFALRKTPLIAVVIVKFVVLEPLRLLEIAIYERRIRNHEVNKAPIFIIGHWRSGTTHLQHLLSAGDQHTTSSVYQFLFSDTFILTENWLKKPLNYLCRLFRLKYSFQRVPMDLDLPGELESAMCTMGSAYSYTWGHIFPKNFRYWFRRFALLKNSSDAQHWLADYEYLIKKFSFASKGKRIVIKSPGDTSRTTEIIKRFPDAKFVYIHRDKEKVIESSRYFWSVILKQISFQYISNEEVERIIIDTYNDVINAYSENRGLISDRLVEIKFDELLEDPTGVLQKTYNTLDLGEMPQKEVNDIIVRMNSLRNKRPQRSE